LNSSDVGTRLERMTSQITDRLSMSFFFEKLYTTRQKRPPLKALILLSDLRIEEFEKIIRERRKLAKTYSINLTKLESDLYGLSLTKLVRKRTVKGFAIIDLSHKGIWLVLCNEKSYFLKRALERLFIALYPKISRLYLNYSQIRVLLDAIREAYEGQTTLTYFTIKREPKRTQSIFRERGTFQLWEENAEEELLRQSKDYRLTVDRVNFEVRDERNTLLLQAHISRRGICKLRFGSFSTFYENVLLKAIDLGLNWKRFYGHRERVIREGKIWLRPFRINYPFDLDERQLHRLADKISTSYSCSIVHGGNPYFVANLCDYQDGSSFGVTALGNIVTITPITKGTHQAAWKLTNRIQEILGDGEIISVSG
jgi:hypothetical protein